MVPSKGAADMMSSFILAGISTLLYRIMSKCIIIHHSPIQHILLEYYYAPGILQGTIQTLGNTKMENAEVILGLVELGVWRQRVVVRESQVDYGRQESNQKRQEEK